MRWRIAALGAVLLLSACAKDGGEEADGAPPARADGQADAGSDPRPDSELVTWLDDFCDARFAVDLPYPPVAPMPSTETDRQPLLDYLADVDAALVAAKDAVLALPPPPVEAANDLVEAYVADVEEFQSRIDEHTSRAGSFPADRLDAVYRLSGLDIVSYVPGGEAWQDDVEASPELSGAYEEATSCP